MKSYSRYPLILTLSYLLFGTVWILWSDGVVATFAKSQEEILKLESFKGIVFVFLSGLMILLLSVVFNRRHLRHEKKLQELYHNDEMIFNSLPLGFAVLDLGGKFTKVNRNLSRILGYSEEELLKMSRFDITLPEEHYGDTNMREMTMREGERVFTANKKLIAKDGKQIWCSISFLLLRNAKGDPKHFILSVQDVDGEMKMNEQLRQLNHELLEAQRTGNFGHWDYSYATKSLKISNQVYNILQLDEEVDSQQQVMELLGKEIIENMRVLIEDAKSEGRKLNNLLSLKLKSGQTRHLNVEAFVIFDCDGKAQQLKGTLKDVTKVISLQKEKDTFNNNLKNLAFSLSHEVRRPLGSILGLTQLINESISKSNEQEELLNYLQKSVSELDEQTKILNHKMYQMQLLFNEEPDFKSDLELYHKPVFSGKH